MTGTLVVAYVDIAGVTSLNERSGRDAGDALLSRVVSAIREQFRSYDPVVRLGGDEFLCVLSGVTPENARARFAAVEAAFGTSADADRISVGFAALLPTDAAADLIERADADRPASPDARP
jgi:diguanylate cyclase (GGDEF)-like protein